MGLANLVPGISGGTMLVAAGVYRRFIDAISDLSRLKLRTAPLVTLAAVVIGAATAIVTCSGLIASALVEARWVMYSLFIGLTLGGAPLLWKLIHPITTRAVVGLVVGFVVMFAVTQLQSSSASAAGAAEGPFILLIAGAAAASAMILPGVSGAYLLLLLGAYEPILAAIRDSKDAVLNADPAALMTQMRVVLPIGIGVLVGVVGVSNILHFVLHRFEKVTLGFLLGLLLAAPLGLYPFVQSVPPQPGQNIRGRLVTPDNIDSFESKDWPEARFTPSAGHVAGSLALIAIGFGATLGVARLGRDRSASDPAQPD
ncbi:MAG: hypothetical protein Kow0022_10740 [Phycisphaerales bacterium]